MFVQSIKNFLDTFGVYFSPARSFVEGRLKPLSVVWIAGPCVCTRIYPPRARNCSANNIEEMEDCCALCTSCKQAIYLSDEVVPVCQLLFDPFLVYLYWTLHTSCRRAPEAFWSSTSIAFHSFGSTSSTSRFAAFNCSAWIIISSLSASWIDPTHGVSSSSKT